MKVVVAAIATNWGTNGGGINAFNLELVKSLAIAERKNFELLCVFPYLTKDEEANCGHYADLVVPVHRGRHAHPDKCVFQANDAKLIAAAIGRKRPSCVCVLIGHDMITGPTAVSVRNLLPDSKAVVIHHMSYAAYQSVKHHGAAATTSKSDGQYDLFASADATLAVGPLLLDELKRLLAQSHPAKSQRMIVPGLVDPEAHGAKVLSATLPQFEGFVAGRLDPEDDMVKQSNLSVRAFGRAIALGSQSTEVDSTLRHARLCMFGVAPKNMPEIQRALFEAAGRPIPMEAHPFSTNRQHYFRRLASASVALAPSWHDGFGLVAWEAIACAVPVVVGANSGVYRLLEGECSNLGIGQSVRHVNVVGAANWDGTGPNHVESDISAVAHEIGQLAKAPETSKRQALTLLRNLREKQFNWRSAAAEVISSIEELLGVSLRLPLVEPASHGVRTEVTADSVPTWLQVPAPMGIRPELAATLPSLLLVARERVVRFDRASEPDVVSVCDWLEKSDVIDLMLIAGGGGAGKTRLAIEVAERCQRAHWLPIWLSNELPLNWCDGLRATLRASVQPKRLVVVDYADARQSIVRDLLVELLADANRAEVSAVRVLLLGRTMGWWHQLRSGGSTDEFLRAFLAARPTPYTLTLRSWNPVLADRERSFRDAVRDFAAALGRPVRGRIVIPPTASNNFDSPLLLQMAALATLAGDRAVGADGLALTQLEREWYYWAKLHSDLCSREDFYDSLALVALLGGGHFDSLSSCLRSLVTNPLQIAQALVESYPGNEAATASPFQPDVLAELLVREQLVIGRAGEALRIALCQPDPDPTLAFLGRMSAFRVSPDRPRDQWEQELARRLADVFPILGQRLLDTAIFSPPGFGTVLADAWSQVSSAVQVDLAQELNIPDDFPGLFELSLHMARQRVCSADSAEQSRANFRLATVLSRFPDPSSHREGLLAIEASLATLGDAKFEHASNERAARAEALNILANYLSSSADSEAVQRSLKVAQEVLQTFRELDEKDHLVYGRSFERALVNAANRYLQLERPDAAVELAEEAFKLRERRVHEGGGGSDVLDLINAACVVAHCQLRLGKPQSAIDILMFTAVWQSFFPPQAFPHIADRLGRVWGLLSEAHSRLGGQSAMVRAKQYADRSVWAFDVATHSAPGAFASELGMAIERRRRLGP